jgi:hypothetical protein
LIPEAVKKSVHDSISRATTLRSPDEAQRSPGLSDPGFRYTPSGLDCYSVVASWHSSSQKELAGLPILMLAQARIQKHLIPWIPAFAGMTITPAWNQFPEFGHDATWI